MNKAIFLLSILFTTNSFACGHAHQLFLKYWDTTGTESKARFLDRINCPLPSNYRPDKADPVIAKVLSDAITVGVNSKKIIKILHDYNCAYGARKLSAYNKIRTFMGNHKNICDIDKLQRTYLVTAKSGVFLRSGAAAHFPSTGKILAGTPVEVINTTGDWAMVNSYEGRGYLYKAYLSPY